MGASRLEINVERLLNKCELMANDDPNRDWRLEMYIKSLEKMIKDLHIMPNSCRPEKPRMSDYVRRCTFLKGLIKTEQLETVTEKVMAVQLLSHGLATTEKNPVTKEIHQKTSVKYGQELRDDLFGRKKDSLTESTLRLRKNSLITNSSVNAGEDLDLLIKYHHSMQEKIAENMLSMAQNLKEQSEMASSIIKKDTEIVSKSAKMTDDNLSSLKAESTVLADHNKRAWKCSLLFMIILVIAIFISMVMFMKLFKKRVILAQ